MEKRFHISLFSTFSYNCCCNAKNNGGNLEGNILGKRGNLIAKNLGLKIKKPQKKSGVLRL